MAPLTAVEPFMRPASESERNYLATLFAIFREFDGDATLRKRAELRERLIRAAHRFCDDRTAECQQQNDH